jgi:hypothetical protein
MIASESEGRLCASGEAFRHHEKNAAYGISSAYSFITAPLEYSARIEFDSHRFTEAIDIAYDLSVLCIGAFLASGTDRDAC